MLHGEGQIIFTVIIVLVMVSTSTTLPASYQPGYDGRYDGYQPAGYRGRIKKEPQLYSILSRYSPVRKGRDYNKPAYYNAADKEQKSYYEPISEWR